MNERHNIGNSLQLVVRCGCLLAGPAVHLGLLPCCTSARFSARSIFWKRNRRSPTQARSLDPLLPPHHRHELLLRHELCSSRRPWFPTSTWTLCPFRKPTAPPIERTRVPRSEPQIRSDRGGAHDRLPACIPPHGTRSCVRGALSLPAGFDGVRRGAALPQIRNRVVRPICGLPSTSTAPCSSVFSPSSRCGAPLSAPSLYKTDGQTEPCGRQSHQLSDVQRFSSLCFFARLISKHEATTRWSGLGTMLIARVQCSREAAGCLVLCMLMVSWMRVTNSTCQLGKLLS